MLAERIKYIKPSVTLSLNQRALELKKEGIDVINLSLGESDFDTPQFVLDGAFSFIEKKMTRYTEVSGVLSLREAVCKKFLRDNQLSYNPSQVVIATGGKQVIFNAFMATLNPGDEVIIPAPYWVSYVDIVELFGAKAIVIPCHAEQGYKITKEQLDQAITPKTKWLIINSPSNPTGAVYTQNELIALSHVLQKNPHVWVLSDDIYEYLIYDNIPFYNLPMVDNTLQGRTLIVNGVSKSHAMTGWRIGYGVGPLSLIKAMTMLQSQSTSNACSIAQGAALAALSHPHVQLKEWVDEYAKRRNVVVSGLSKIDGFKCLIPNGAFYVYVECADIMKQKGIASDLELCEILLTKYRVAVVPGSAFGMPGSFRISYSASLDQLQQAIQRIKEFQEASA